MRRFGLIGYPLGHSFSRVYFNAKFEREGYSDCLFDNYPLENINELPALLLSQPQLCGLCVTIPYKEKVISYLHEVSDVVKSTGACNCISIQGDRLSGHNTDVIGFKTSLQKGLKPYHKKALILGEGGAAKAVAYVLGMENIQYRFVVRAGEESAQRLFYSSLNEDIMREHLLIINTTPLGTFPAVDEAPPIPYSALTDRHYLFDLVYNPAQTLFLKHGAEKNCAIRNGQEMLELQAEAAWKIWNEAY